MIAVRGIEEGGWQDSPLRNLERIRELRILLKSIQGNLDKMGKAPMQNEGIILGEKSILDATHREIRRLEKKNLSSEFGLE